MIHLLGLMMLGLLCLTKVSCILMEDVILMHHGISDAILKFNKHLRLYGKLSNLFLHLIQLFVGDHGGKIKNGNHVL